MRVAITAETPEPGYTTEASHAVDIGVAARFVIEIEKLPLLESAWYAMSGSSQYPLSSTGQ